MTPALESATTPFGLALGQPVQGRGGQNCAITDASNGPLVFQLGDAANLLSSAFGAGVYGDAAEQAAATRLNLDVNVADRPVLLEKLRAMDAEIRQQLPEREFKSDVSSAYKGLLTEDAKYSTVRLRCKLQLTGAHAAKVWRSDKTRVEDPKSIDWRATPFVAVVHFKSVWSMARQAGVVCEIKHLVAFPGGEDAFPLDADAFPV